MMMTTKKSGMNCGRAFWMCSRYVYGFLFPPKILKTNWMDGWFRLMMADVHLILFLKHIDHLDLRERKKEGLNGVVRLLSGVVIGMGIRLVLVVLVEVDKGFCFALPCPFFFLFY